VIFGTAMAGLIAARSFSPCSSLTQSVSCIAAALLFRLLPETKPQVREERGTQGRKPLETVKGYRSSSVICPSRIRRLGVLH